MLQTRRSTTTFAVLGLTFALGLAACGGDADTGLDAADPSADAVADGVDTTATTAAGEPAAGATTSVSQEPGVPTTATDGAAAPAPTLGGPLTDEAVAAVLGPTADVSAAVGAIAPFPALPTPSDAEVVQVSSRTVTEGDQTTDWIVVRYLSTIDGLLLPDLFGPAATANGWEAIPFDSASYGGGSSVFAAVYDIPGIGEEDYDDLDDDADVEISAEPFDEGRVEITIGVTAVGGGFERFDQLLAAVPLPSGQQSTIEFGFSAAATDGGVRSTRQVTLAYPTDVAALQEEIVGLVGTPTSVTPVDPGPGIVEASGVGGIDVLRYESWLGLNGDTAAAASSVVVDAEWTTTG